MNRIIHNILRYNNFPPFNGDNKIKKKNKKGKKEKEVQIRPTIC